MSTEERIDAARSAYAEWALSEKGWNHPLDDDDGWRAVLAAADESGDSEARRALRDLTARIDFHGIHQEWNELAAARAVLSENP